jgi:TIR domain-containing protein
MKAFKAFISYKHAKSTSFAERLELSLKAYAKPLYRPPMAVFRDEKYLRPGSDLPSRIREALEGSDFLIYLASPEAAASPWVGAELAQWCAREERRERLIIVLTQGTIAVDAETQRIDWQGSDALPGFLADQLSRLPLFVDLSWAERDEQQTILNPEYKKAVNRIVAALRGVDPIDLSGEEVLQHRRNLRIRNSFVAAIGVLALALAGAAAVAWQQKLQADQQRRNAEEQRRQADARAREATSRRLAAEADRIAEERIDVALLLMAQAYTMSDNASLRSAWWRLLGAPNLPDTYLPVRGSDVRFEPDGTLVVRTAEQPAVFAHAGGAWSRAARREAAAGEASPAVQWRWSGGCERQECDETAEWRCSQDEGRIIGPYGDSDTFCVRSALTVPGWCHDAPIDVPGFRVDASRSGPWVFVTTNAGSAAYHCAAEATPAGPLPPRLVAGDQAFFPDDDERHVIALGAPAAARLSVSFDDRWLAVLRGDQTVEVWSRGRTASPRARPGVVVLDGDVQAIAATPDGAIALALAPASGSAGDVVLWKQAAQAVAGQPPDRRFAGIWVRRGQRFGVLALSADARRIATGADVFITLLDTETGRALPERFEIGRHGATFAEFSPAADRLAVVARPLDGALNVPGRVFGWGVEPARLGDGVERMAFPAGARDLVLTAGGAGVQEWPLPSGPLKRTLVERAADGLAFDPRSGHLAISFADRTLEVRNAEGARVAASSRRASATRALAFSSSEPALLWAAETGLQVWNWPANSWIAVDSAPHLDVRSLPDGQVLALRQNRAVVYDLRPTRWLEMTCGIVRRTLTSDEWRTHLGAAFPYEPACATTR